MSNEHAHITDFDFSLIANFFKKMPRQGPGCDEQTLKALSFVKPLGPGSRIADLGCGTGKQTEVLAAHTDAHITAIDFLPEMIEGLTRRMTASEFAERVTGIVGSMGELPFGPGELDLIWAEGSIYNIGYENGLRYWHSFLKPGGFVAVTESCWLSDARPDDIDDLLKDLPEIDTIANKVQIMQEAGYKPVAHFVLPEYCWTDNYYAETAKRIPAFLEEENNSPAAQFLAERSQWEMEYYTPKLDYFSYVFLIGQKI